MDRATQKLTFKTTDLSNICIDDRCLAKRRYSKSKKKKNLKLYNYTIFFLNMQVKLK